MVDGEVGIGEGGPQAHPEPVSSFVAEIGVATAEQKVGFLREIAKAELAAAEANLEMMKQLWTMIEEPDPR